MKKVSYSQEESSHSLKLIKNIPNVLCQEHCYIKYVAFCSYGFYAIRSVVQCCKSARRAGIQVEREHGSAYKKTRQPARISRKLLYQMTYPVLKGRICRLFSVDGDARNETRMVNSDKQIKGF